LTNRCGRGIIILKIQKMLKNTNFGKEDRTMANSRKRHTKTSRVKAAPNSNPCCKIEALVTIDGRGQILLPKEVREKAGLQPGDKLALISYESDEGVTRITLVRADKFAETAREMLGPMMGLLST
jgi:antitoxin PrlF